MKVLVTVKRVVDYRAKIRITPDQKRIDCKNVKMSMNPFDEVAIEEARILKEKGIVKEIIAVSCGALQCEETLRTAMAMGADRGILVQDSGDIQPLGIAKLLKFIVKMENPKLVILGRQAIDDDACQTGQILASLLDWPQATFVRKVELFDNKVQVDRVTDDGTETIMLKLPAIITVELYLNQPRYLTLPSIMKAKKKTLSVLQACDLGVDILPRLETLKITRPPIREAGVTVPDVASLVDKLKNEAGVI